MNRNEKIAKLCNAIWEYRGRMNSEMTHWKQPPRPSALQRVVNWCERLNLPVFETIQKIESFKRAEEFNAWLKTL